MLFDGIFTSIFIVANRKNIFFIILLFITFNSGCKKNNPIESYPPGIDPGIVFHPPYDSPIWHPNGKYIGFNHTPLTGITYPYGQGVNAGQESFDYDSAGFWLIDADGTNMRRIFPYTLLNPAWSSDGQWIAFSLAVGDGVQIFKMRFTGTSFDTTSLMQLTYSGRNFFPAWSTDGKWLSYTESICDNLHSCGLWITSYNGTQQKFLTPYGSFPCWLPSQNKIMYSNNAVTPSKDFGDSLWIYDLNKNTKSFVLLLSGVNIDNRNIEYSPSGLKIAFWSSNNIWIMDTTGKNQRQLTTGGVDVDFGPPFSWSPDGTSIVYTSYQANNWDYGNGTLWIINVNTGIKKQLTFNLKAASKGGE